MEIRLDEFEYEIDGTILERGFDSFRKGRVTEVDEFGGGDYGMTVEGPGRYTVRLRLQGNTVRYRTQTGNGQHGVIFPKDDTPDKTIYHIR